MKPSQHHDSKAGPGGKASFGRLLLHLHPRQVPARAISLTHTWGLGGMALVLVLLQLVSGVFLLFVYRTDAAGAYESVAALQQGVLFGGFLRNIHHWSANFLVLITLLHMLRVFYTGAFHGDRAFNWIIGLGLFVLVLGANFTGYLLPWDQLAYWAVTICTGMMAYVPAVGAWLQHILRGGAEVGPATLSNFFVLHVMALPLCFLLLLPFHFWRIRKAGGVVFPRGAGEASSTSKAMVPSSPDLVVREMAMAMMVLALVFMISALVDAPLQAAANPGLSPNPTKPPWYFSGLQELLLHFHPTVAVVVLPLFCAAGLGLLPYLGFEAGSEGIWFASAEGRRSSLLAAIVGLVAALAAVALDEVLRGGSVSIASSDGLWRGVISTGVILALAAGFSLFVRKRFRTGRVEMAQAAFTLLLFAMIVLTVIGVWFRGPDMALTWHG